MAELRDTVREFADRQVDVLTLTDLASKGLKIKQSQVKHVISWDLPNIHTYIQRVGRIANTNGICSVFVNRMQSYSIIYDIKMLFKYSKQNIPTFLDIIVNSDEI